LTQYAISFEHIWSSGMSYATWLQGQNLYCDRGRTASQNVMRLRITCYDQLSLQQETGRHDKAVVVVT